MMLMAFASIYLIAYRDVYANINMELHRLSDFSRKPDKNFDKRRGDFDNPPNELLYLTQVDYSDMKTVFAKFNMSEAVENVILTMEAIIFEHNISLDYNIDPNLITYGNCEQIKQVVMVLLDNAIKYTNTNGSVDISLKRQHNGIVFSVTNSGEGIKEEHLEKIFDRFYRTDKSRARKLGGYGLGLAIARAIIDQHKGKIYARSAVNENTTFFVELPLVSD